MADMIIFYFSNRRVYSIIFKGKEGFIIKQKNYFKKIAKDENLDITYEYKF